MRSVIGMRSRNASATRDSNAGYTTGVFRTWRTETGEFRPSCNDGIGGREVRFCSNTVRIGVVAADIDIDLSCAVRSRRPPGSLGTVLADSEDRREDVTDAWSISVIEGSDEDTGEVLITEERIDAAAPTSTCNGRT